MSWVTFLFWAAKSGDAALVAKLLKEGADPNVRDVFGRTPLHRAAEEGHAAVVELLLKHGADPNARNWKEETPLHLAAGLGWRDVVYTLLTHGADPNARDRYSYTPLDRAAREGRVAVVELLLKHGADPNLRDESGYTPLHHAAQEGHTAVVELLLKHGVDPNLRARSGSTPLHLAAGLGWRDVVYTLLTHGADPNARNEDGETPLHYAADNGHVEVVGLLLTHGADPNVRDVFGRTPLHRAALGGRVAVVELLLKHGADLSVEDQNGQAPIHYAVRGGHMALVELLVERHGLFRQWGHLLLPEAARRCDVGRVRYLLERDAAANADALCAAVQAGCVEAAELLLKHGVDPNKQRCEYGYPIHIAIGKGDLQMAELLLKHGADPNLLDGVHGTPLRYAAKHCGENKDLALRLFELLIKYGADPLAKSGEETGLYSMWRRCGPAVAGLAERFRDALPPEEALEMGFAEAAERLRGRDPIKLLFKAADECMTKLAEWALAAGADPNARDDSGCTALHYATCVDVVYMLLKHGADPNAGCLPPSSYLSVIHAMIDRVSTETEAWRLVVMHPAWRRLDDICFSSLASEDEDMVYLMAQRGAHAGPCKNLPYSSDRLSVWMWLRHGDTDVNAKDVEEETALHKLAKAEALEVLDAAKTLLKLGADPNVRDRNGNTPLHTYILYYCYPRAFLSLLIRHGADPLARNSQGETPLDLLPRCDVEDIWTVPIVRIFLRRTARPGGDLLLKVRHEPYMLWWLTRAGADPNARDAEGRPLLRLVVEGGLRWENERAAAKVLLEAGAEADEALAAALDLSPLHLAALKGDVELAEELLKLGLGPDARDVFGRTPLHYAAARNHRAVAELLLSHGADPNARDEDGETPLDLAAKWCSANAAELLLSRGGSGGGAARWAVDGDCPELLRLLGVRPDAELVKRAAKMCSLEALDYLLGLDPSLAPVAAKEDACLEAWEVAARRAVGAGAEAALLHMGAEPGRSDLAEALLRLGVGPDLRDEAGRTPLHKAAAACSLAVDVFLEAGADPNARDKDGNTPLHLAAEAGCIHAVELLLKYGADPNARNARGETPLHKARSPRSRLMSPAIADMLLKAGADPNVRDGNGNTPLHVAVATCSLAAAAALLKYGADPNVRNNEGKTPADLLNCPTMTRAFKTLLEKGDLWL